MKPTLKIDLNKIYENALTVKNTLGKYNVDVTAVTKLHSCNEKIVNTLMDAGINKFADSRIENLENIKDMDTEKWLIRLPSISQAEDVVKYSDISLNSEYDTIKALNEAAKHQKKKHGILLMFDVGDLREGYFEKDDIINNAKKIKKLSNIEIKGIATNLTCYGGVLPDKKNLSHLVSINSALEKELDMKLNIVSGGNSTSYTLFRENNPVEGITNIRVGDTIYFGRDCTYRTHIDGMYKDAFTLKAEIIEIKDKPSVPIGKRGFSALNSKPEFKDEGIRKRAILSVGKQDIDLDMFPLDENTKILGGSSDHLIIDITDSSRNYKIGDTFELYMYYTSVLRAFTSKYVVKEFVR
ncbi:alanine/ornithine racemase family PLP-dependent enzyme [Anaerofustis sp.]|uniref:alanine/ornithine racemase family PLP-dependent enzyme n=1 Tax=Anaerofustis sp. TaxID=1872517 RepID=UPI0025BC5C96|nr:alanine/ornithine racemase family PLP-dependent enzyme [Anaerofustis sp.]